MSRMAKFSLPRPLLYAGSITPERGGRLRSNHFDNGAQRECIFLIFLFHTLVSSSSESSWSFSFSLATLPTVSTCKDMKVEIRMRNRIESRKFTSWEEVQLWSSNSTSTLSSEGRPKRGESWGDFATKIIFGFHLVVFSSGWIRCILLDVLKDKSE